MAIIGTCPECGNRAALSRTFRPDQMTHIDGPPCPSPVIRDRVAAMVATGKVHAFHQLVGRLIKAARNLFRSQP